MKTTYDPVADAYYARFAPESAVVATTTEVAPGVMVDLDAAGHLTGIEVLSVKLHGTGTYADNTEVAAE